MMRYAEQRFFHEQGSVKGDLVHVIDYEVELLRFKGGEIFLRDTIIEERSSSFTNNVNAVHLFFFQRAVEAGTEKCYVMPCCCDTLEDFVEMDFRSPREGVFDILPVEDENTQGKQL